ncbi:MAG: hypothetical protein GY862_04575, partial [Gammaproteobacteria bacterium]|nr:hypothetical protein [Gammaproteobacteria bacterium]
MQKVFNNISACRTHLIRFFVSGAFLLAANTAAAGRLEGLYVGGDIYPYNEPGATFHVTLYGSQYPMPIQWKVAYHRPGGVLAYETFSQFITLDEDEYTTWMHELAIAGRAPGMQLGEWTAKLFVNTTGIPNTWNELPYETVNFTTASDSPELSSQTFDLKPHMPDYEPPLDIEYYTEEENDVYFGILFDWYQHPVKIKVTGS